jgi:hypothetical protein
VIAVAGKDLYRLVRALLHPFFSPLKDVPGPKSNSAMFGHFKEILEADPGVLHEKWAKEFGPVLKYKMILNVRHLFCVLRFLVNCLYHYVLELA